MPGAAFGTRAPLAEQLIPFRHVDGAGDAVAGAILLVGHPLVSLALAVLLARRLSSPLLAVAAFAGAVAVEVVLKQIVERGPLELDGRHLEVYDHAFPSGHATRTTFLFLVAALVWPRARAWLALWMTAVVVALVLDGWHVPTDVAGGMLLAAALVLALSPQPVTAPEPSASSSTARSRSD